MYEMGVFIKHHQNNGFFDNGAYLYNEYIYDANANMIYDTNKRLRFINIIT
jgi:hypothetical protein